VLDVAWLAIAAVVAGGSLLLLWRWVWEQERTGEAGPLVRQRALIGFVVLVALLLFRDAATGFWGWH
jgi:hypothetical protein